MARAPVCQTNIFDSKSSPEGQTDISSRHYNYLLHAYVFKLDSSLELYSISIRASIVICNHSKEHQFAVTIWKVRSRNSIKKGPTMKWPKIQCQFGINCLQNVTQQTEVWATTIPLKTEGSRGANVLLKVKQFVISHELGKNNIVLITKCYYIMYLAFCSIWACINNFSSVAWTAYPSRPMDAISLIFYLT